MEFSNNELGICDEPQPIVSSSHNPSTLLDSCNQFSKNSNFTKPTEQIFEVPPRLLITFFWERGVTDGTIIHDTIETESKQLIEWKDTLNYQRWNWEIKELRGRQCTKSQVHEDEIGWLATQCVGGKFQLPLGGDR